MSLPKPYYSHAGQTIYHGDCREILSELPKVDLVLTDPPYGIGESLGKNKSRGKMATSKDYGYATWDMAPPSIELIELVINQGKSAILFGGNYFNVPPSSCWLVWDKDNGQTDFADCELAWTNLPKAVRRVKHKWQGMLQEDMANKEVRHHPTQKPLPVMLWAIHQANNPQTILDPFMGSGTTLVAAKQLGRQGIGIELEERYCEIAALRLSQEVMNFGEVA